MKREYYLLDDAAKILNCGIGDLVYLGATGQLGIYFLSAGMVLVSEKFKDGQVIERHRNEAITGPLKLSRRTVELLEAGNTDILVSFDGELNTTHKISRYTPVPELEDHDPYDFSAMFNDPVAHAKKVKTRIKAEYSDVKISDVRLVVKHDELMSIIDVVSPKNSGELITAITINNPDKPSCGTKSNHKLIDRAFYSINKPADKISPNDVIGAIKQERLDGGIKKILPKIDIDCIIKEITGNVISWQTESMGEPTGLSYKQFSTLVRNLVKANAGKNQ